MPHSPSPPSTLDPSIGHIESILETVTPLRSQVYQTPRHADYRVHPPYSAGSGAVTTSSYSPPPSSSTSYADHAPAPDHAVSSALLIHKHLDLMFPDDGSRHILFDDHCPGESLQLPEPSLMFKVLHLYEHNIHPLIKVVHMPTVRERLCDITADPAVTNSQDHALFFAMLTLVIKSITSYEAERLFHSTDKKPFIEQHRRNTQTSLCRVGVWRSSSLAALQAYFLHLLAVGGDVDPRIHAICTGNAARMAQRWLSIPKRQPVASSSEVSSSAVNQELAIRVWWEIQACDLRASEKSGIASNPTLATATTRLPRDASDIDLEQTMPPTWVGAPSPLAAQLRAPSTESLFLLLRCEVTQFQLHPPWSQQHTDHHCQHHPFRQSTFFKQLDDARKRRNTSSLAWQLAAVDAFESYIDKRYFDRPEATSNALVHYAFLFASMSIEKLRMLVHLNHRRAENDVDLIRICTAQVERIAALIGEKQYFKYKWYTYAHLPFFSFFVLLDMLRRHTTGEAVDKAWLAIERSSVIWTPDLHDEKGQESFGTSALDDFTDRGMAFIGPPSSATPNSCRSSLNVATPNSASGAGKSEDLMAKMRVRGTMLAALLVAAWEKRLQVLTAQGGSDLLPPEPRIVSAMRSIVIAHHAPQHECPPSPPHSYGDHPTGSRQLHLLHDSDGQAVQEGATADQLIGAQREAGAEDGPACTAFLNQQHGTFSSAFDDAQSLNALLQSSVDLDWTAWFNQSWGPTPDPGTAVAAPSQFMPSW